jgi:hypothetical protein
MIDDRKIMVTIIWNPHGFHLIDTLTKSQTFNATYYANIILSPLLDGRSSGPGAGLMIHADDARPHTARKTLNSFWENHVGIAPHLPDSPELVPSDFFLFGYVKRALGRVEFPSKKALLIGIQLVLSHRTPDTLRAIFAKWVERLNWIAFNECHYYR